MADTGASPTRGRWSLVVLAAVTLALLALAIIQLLPKSSSSRPLALATINGRVLISGATVTSTAAGGSTAISMKVVNGSRGAVDVVSVASPEATSGRLHFDSNMCEGTSVMVQIPNIQAPSGRVLSFGLRGVGAMLMGLHHQLRPRDHVSLVVTWSGGDGHLHSSTILASVEPRPAHLHFGSMGSMRM